MRIIEAIDPDRWLSTWIALKFSRDVSSFWSRAYPDNPNLNNLNDQIGIWLGDKDRNPEGPLRQAYVAMEKVRRLSNESCEMKSKAAGYSAIYAVQQDCKLASFQASVASQSVLDITKSERINAYIYNMIREHLDFIVDYKLKNNQSFGNFGKVFGMASDTDNEKLIWNLNLREHSI